MTAYHRGAHAVFLAAGLEKTATSRWARYLREAEPQQRYAALQRLRDHAGLSPFQWATPASIDTDFALSHISPIRRGFAGTPAAASVGPQLEVDAAYRQARNTMARLGVPVDPVYRPPAFEVFSPGAPDQVSGFYQPSTHTVSATTWPALLHETTHAAQNRSLTARLPYDVTQFEDHYDARYLRHPREEEARGVAHLTDLALSDRDSSAARAMRLAGLPTDTVAANLRYLNGHPVSLDIRGSLLGGRSAGWPKKPSRALRKQLNALYSGT